MSDDDSLESWIIKHSATITEARRVSVAPLETEPGPMANQMSHVRKCFVSVGFLLQDAKTWVLKSHAVATQETRKNNPDLTAEERRIVTKADPTYLRALDVEGKLDITVAALKSLHYEAMSVRKTTYNPHAQTQD